MFLNLWALPRCKWVITRQNDFCYIIREMSITEDDCLKRQRRRRDSKKFRLCQYKGRDFQNLRIDLLSEMTCCLTWGGSLFFLINVAIASVTFCILLESSPADTQELRTARKNSGNNNIYTYIFFSNSCFKIF